MKYITKKQIDKFLNRVATKVTLELGPDEEHKMDSWMLKADGSYLCADFDRSFVKRLMKRGITDHLQNQSMVAGNTVNIGFNPEEGRWYGWSHRAIYGFKIGSKCEPGHVHYVPKDRDDFLEDCTRFWTEDTHEWTESTFHLEDGAIKGVNTEWKYNDKVSNKKLPGTISSVFSELPDKYGKGSWTAETMKDAKEMAIDFARGCS